MFLNFSSRQVISSGFPLVSLYPPPSLDSPRVTYHDICTRARAHSSPYRFASHPLCFSSVAGSFRTIKDISIREMLPDIKYYMTYEGSTTHPGCWETTVWIVLNKPIYITRREVSTRCTGCPAEIRTASSNPARQRVDRDLFSCTI